jgi:hypothetical protein
VHGAQSLIGFTGWDGGLSEGGDRTGDDEQKCDEQRDG